MKDLSFLRRLLFVLIALVLTGCFENNGASNFASSQFGQSGANGTTQTNGASSLVISNVTITNSGSSSSSTSNPYTTNVFFDTSKSTASISSYCNGSSSSSSSSTSGTSGTSSSTTTATNACVCNFSWVENNTTGANTVPIQRGVQTPVQSVQNALVTCAAPDAYAQNEILNSTVIQVSVLPGSGNGNTFSMTPFPYTKSNSGSIGSFQDNQGNSFQNILRYTCYEQFQRGMTIASQLFPIPNATTGVTVMAPMANQFCVQKINGTASTAQGCQGQLPPPDYSSQAYYFNLYIRDSEQGDINYSNLVYHCPTVKEALGNNGSVGTQYKAYPLDSTFALSLGPTQTFPVGVEAYTKLSDGSNDAVAQNSSCYPDPTASSTPTSGGSSGSSSGGSTLIKSCLGFAAKPNPDGTCPYFRDANNQIRFTYRLRRYIAIYPPLFDTDGTVLQQAQASDTIYVLDRPVKGPDPMHPYTMAGPKPCPFAFFDHAGVSGIADSNYPTSDNDRPGYFATNSSFWNGKNVDGIQLPNTDSPNSCSAVVGLLNSSKTIMTLGTVNAVNVALPHVYIRPITAFAPHYIEDTSFQACAPESSPMRDPPLHFAKDSNGNVGWCAEAYPSQNPNVSAVDPFNSKLNGGTGGYGGDVAPFTSHVVKNSSSAPCTATSLTLPSNYCKPGTNLTGDVTTGSAVISNPSTLVGIGVGQAISSAAFGAGTLISSIDTTNNTITVNSTSLVSATTEPITVSICAAEHPSTYPADPNGGTQLGANETCDRTVNSSPQDWLKFPLLAPPADVESAIENDMSNYGCLLTYDGNGPKTGKSSPSGGCCGSTVKVVTGTGAGPTTAHLEPDVSCLTPNY